MSHILYIAEKPSVARAIAAELGVLRREEGALVCRGNTVVTWCFGHLLEQAEPDAYLRATLDAKVSFRDKSLYWSHGKCDTLKNSKTTLFPAF